MIHVLNYEENIIEDLSFKQDAIYEAEHNLNVQDMMETFDFTVASKIAGNLRDRNRIIIQDHMGIYREFIVEMITDLEDGTTEIQSNASYLNDITTAKPLKPKKFTNEMPTVILDYILADTGWEVADDSEVPGDFTIEWDKVIDRAEALKILQEETDMRLTYFIEVSGNKVNKRYVSIKKVDPLFNGEEIVYEDNLIGLKREIDFSEVATALLGVGPEESDDNNKEKERLYVEVVDDKAQEQFGLPQRYIWDYYEVPTESDEKVTKKLLEKRTKKELDERKKASVVYEVSSNAINAQVGDMIRVKDEHIVPEIYLEAEIIEINYDLLSKTKEYKFGILREFTRDQVYRQFNKFREELEKRLKDAVSNTDSIISERLEEELKYVERYIEKSPTPPLNPQEGQLWLDTSHDGVAVLKRYENGEWIKSSVDDVKDIGGMTREETMYEALKERSVRNEVDYSEVFKRHGALVSEKHYHYVDEDIKNDLTNRYNALQKSYDDFKIAFNNINAEQPTIGLITTAISRAIEFEARLKEYNDSYYIARKSFDEVIELLQSQYSDEKYSDAMQELAEQIGGEWNGNELIVDGKVYEKFQDVRNELERQDNLLKNTIDETEYISDELSKSQSAIEQHSYELNTKVGYTEMNGTQKTLEKLLTEFSQSSTGFNFRIDSNGMIQDLTFNKDRFKLNSNLIEFNDGDVVIKDGRTTIKESYIDKLFSKTAFIEQLKAVDIDLNRATIHGGDNTNNIKLDHQSIMSYGTFTRSWGGETDTANLELGLYDGQLRMRNLDTGYRLYLTERGLSTSMDGAIDEFTSGTLEFHSQRFNRNSRGVTMHSSYGAVAMISDYSTAYIRSNLTANIESNEYSVYIRPTRLSRNGLNEFAFYVKGNDSPQETDGTILFGDLTGDNTSGSGLRFSKRRNLNTVYVTNINGDIGTGDISVKDAEIRGSIRTIGGLDVRTWDGKGYNQLRAGALNTYNSVILKSHSGGNAYLGVGGYELRITNNNGYNGGNTVYRPIRAGNGYFDRIEYSSWYQRSTEKLKKDIKPLHFNALEVIERASLYEFKYKKDNEKMNGLVVERGTPEEWIAKDGKSVNTNKIIMTLIQANKQLNQQVKILKNKVNRLEKVE